MNVLVVDVGGTHVKILATRSNRASKVLFGAVDDAGTDGLRSLKTAGDWNYEAVSIGYPGPVHHEPPCRGTRITSDAVGSGSTFDAAFGCPVKIINDAAMQALGSYQGGKMLFLGLGTGLGSALIVDGIVEPMELGHLPYKRKTYEDYVGISRVETAGQEEVAAGCRRRGGPPDRRARTR